MTNEILMRQDLIRIRDLDAYSGFTTLETVITVFSNDEVYIDLLFKSDKKFFRVAEKTGKVARRFKSITTAVNLLKSEGYKEVIIKFVENNLDELHVAENSDPKDTLTEEEEE